MAEPARSASTPRPRTGGGDPAAKGRGAVGVVVNARSRRGDACDLEPGLDVLRGAGLAVEVVPSRSPEDMRRILRDAAGSWERVVLVGGDGTLHAALPALLEASLPLGVVPMGTANDFARNLELPLDIEAACGVVAAGHTRRVDVGEVNGRPFLNVASVGLGTAVTRRLTETTKERWGVLSYPRALADALRASRSFRARIRCGAEEHAVRSIQIAVGNGRFYGGGVPIAADASIDDGRLDLYSIAPQPLHRLVVMAVAVRLGRQRDFARVKTLRGVEIGIDTPRPMQLSVDGELEARTPARFRVRPGALAVFVPDKAGAGGAPGLEEGGHP